MDLDHHDPAEVAADNDYWYHHRHDLHEGLVFLMHDNSAVKLDHTVPGDGTKWRVADWYEGSWFYDENTIEPGELTGMPIPDDPDSIAAALKKVKSSPRP